MTLSREPSRPLVTRSWAGDAGLHLGDVADDADDPTAVAEAVEGVHHVVERVGVERAEALVDEEGVEVRATGLLGDDVGQPEGQRQRHHEGLAARQGGRVAGLARPVVADEQAEPAARLAGAPAAGVLEGVALVAHPRQPLVGGRDDLA